MILTVYYNSVINVINQKYYMCYMRSFHLLFILKNTTGKRGGRVKKNNHSSASCFISNCLIASEFFIRRLPFSLKWTWHSRFSWSCDLHRADSCDLKSVGWYQPAGRSWYGICTNRWVRFRNRLCTRRLR